MTRVVAPGKLVLTGAYAVLDAAPAIVVAVDRLAVASRTGVDTSALHDESGRKLGLGSSAASKVASLGLRALERGEDLGDAALRGRLLREARDAHAREQSGGSGVDVAASVYGGALRYSIDPAPSSIQSIDLPSRLVLAAFWSGTPARTSDLRARVDALRTRGTHARFLCELRVLAGECADSVRDASAFVTAARRYGAALAALGAAADAPIVPPAFADLAALASRDDAAFLPSGAGGGDVGVWLGLSPPSSAFVDRARSLAMRPLALSIDRAGVRAAAPASPSEDKDRAQTSMTS